MLRKIVANFLNQSHIRGVRFEDVLQLTVTLRMGTLLHLVDETRANRTSMWKECTVPGIVENTQAFIFGNKGRSAGQLEAAARAPGLFAGLLVDKRIALGWLALNGCSDRDWWEEID